MDSIALINFIVSFLFPAAESPAVSVAKTLFCGVLLLPVACRSSSTFHASVDTVCELVWVTVDPDTASIHDEMMPLIQQLVPAVMQLRPRFAVASRRFAEGVDNCSFNLCVQSFLKQVYDIAHGNG
jgi:hypothetical protein